MFERKLSRKFVFGAQTIRKTYVLLIGKGKPWIKQIEGEKIKSLTSDTVLGYTPKACKPCACLASRPKKEP